MNKIRKTALVGAGIIGRVHAESLRMLDRPLCAICDIDEEKARALAASESPNAGIFCDYRQMIDELSPDVVHICTPHYLHAEMIIYALERDINVLCEKPLCISEDEIKEVLDAEKRSKAKLGVCFQNRYLGANRFAKDYLADKRIKAAHGSVVWNRDAEYYGSADWRGTKDMEGGGVLINQAIHTLDLLEWLCGEPEYVLAATDNLSLTGVIEVEDTVSAFFDGEQPFSIFATNAAASSLPVRIDLKLEGGEKVVVLPDSVTVNGEVRFNAKDQGYLGKPCYGNGHSILIDDFYGCVESGDPFPINGTQAAKSIRLVLAVYRSNREKIKI